MVTHAPLTNITFIGNEKCIYTDKTTSVASTPFNGSMVYIIPNTISPKTCTFVETPPNCDEKNFTLDKNNRKIFTKILTKTINPNLVTYNNNNTPSSSSKDLYILTNTYKQQDDLPSATQEKIDKLERLINMLTERVNSLENELKSNDSKFNTIHNNFNSIQTEIQSVHTKQSN
ncbi:hypothetical protein RhiirA4_472317 [Rhizophagus irregularis]|uniref:Uncharacterized protein n=1 Tax=Rhizophagus irregularis TaxID=588596 RepID=A0A2I1H4R6_9GLOM|nr:hypothetical protein RhiirA4_472317 [Rhizophagus irregularis]